MTEAGGPPPISGAARDAATEWLIEREKGSDPAVERRFAAWLAADPANARAYQEAVNDLGGSEFVAEQRSGRPARLARAPFYMRRNTHIAVATLGAMALLGIVTVTLVEPDGPFPLVSPAHAASYHTGVGEIRTFKLEDGSRVILDTNSRVSTSFDRTERRAHLDRGRARFEVAPDSRPFIISAGDAKIIPDDSVDVSVGSVGTKVIPLRGPSQVQGRASAIGLPSSHVMAGSEVMIRKDGTISRASPATAGEALWVSGMLTLEETPLAAAVAAINRYNRIQIELADATMADLVVSGAFRADDPEAFAEQAAKMFDLKVHQRSGTILLSRR